MELEEAKNIVHRMLRASHMENTIPKWTDKVELAHRIVREHEEKLRLEQDRENYERRQGLEHLL